MSEEKKPTGFGKMNLKDATNKVNAEALRQFQIDAEGKIISKNDLFASVFYVVYIA